MGTMVKVDAAMSQENAGSGVRTRVILLGAIVGSVVIALANNAVMLNPAFVEALYGPNVASASEALATAGAQRVKFIALLGVPVAVLIRTSMMALLVQGVGLMLLVEARFKDAFRIAVIAFVAPLLGQAARILWIARQPLAEVTPELLRVTPGSLAHWVFDVASANPWVYAAFSVVSIFEFMWVWMVAALLGQRAGVSLGRAIVIAMGAWGVMAVGRVVMTALVFQRIG